MSVGLGPRRASRSHREQDGEAAEGYAYAVTLDNWPVFPTINANGFRGPGMDQSYSEGYPSGSFVGIEGGLDGGSSIAGNPDAPMIGFGDEPPESHVAYAGLRIFAPSDGNLLVAVDIEAPGPQHIDDVRGPGRQTGMYGNQNQLTSS